MIYHFVVGDEAAKPLQEAVNAEPSLQGEIIVLKDILHVGPIRKEDGLSFSEMRSAYWHEVAPNEKSPVLVDDMERLLQVSGAMYKNDALRAWFWMAPSPADVTAYYWLLPYLSKHTGRFCLINLAGLPFLNDMGKVYYPKNISEILPKELIKARRLARLVTPSEIEVDGDEWQKLLQENAGMRTLEGGKKLISRSADNYDSQLIGLCTGQLQKTSRIVRQALQKHHLPTGDTWLHWRLRKMAAEGKLLMQGDDIKLAETAGQLSEAQVDL